VGYYRTISKILLLSNICVAGAFGLTLHIYSETGVDDPIISPIYAILKDGWAILAFCICIPVLFRSAGRYKKYVGYYLLISVLMCLGIAVRLPVLGDEELRFIKTVLLYGAALPFLLASERFTSFREVRLAMLLSLGAAMGISALYYAYNPSSSYTLRNFGVFGSPNALGIFSVVSLIISQEISRRYARLTMQAFSIINIVTSMSISSIAMAVLYLTVNFRKNAPIITVVFLSALCFSTWLGVGTYLTRIFQFLDEGSQHDSFSVRKLDYILAFNNVLENDLREFYLMDAAFSTFFYNYGIFGFFIFVVMVFYISALPIKKIGLSVIRSNYYVAMNFILLSSVLQFSVVMYPGALYSSIILYMFFKSDANRDFYKTPVVIPPQG